MKAQVRAARRETPPSRGFTTKAKTSARVPLSQPRAVTPNLIFTESPEHALAGVSCLQNVVRWLHSLTSTVACHCSLARP